MGSVINGRGGASVSHDAQTSLDVVKEVGNRVQLITSGGECSKDGKVNKNDGNQDRDDINGITKEGCGGAITDGKGSILGLCWKIFNIVNWQNLLDFCISQLSGKNGGGGNKEEDHEFVHSDGNEVLSDVEDSGPDKRLKQ